MFQKYRERELSEKGQERKTSPGREGAVTPCSVRDAYVLGLKLIRVRKFPWETRVEVGGIPLFRLEHSPYKTCLRLGKLELFKLRRSGSETGMSDGPLFLEGKSETRRLFWNIGSLAFKDEVSGVARVAKSLLPPLMAGALFEVYPVYTSGKYGGYVYAHDYVQGVMGNADGALDTPVIFRNGDILLSPIPDVKEVETHFCALKTLQCRGVRILFLVHDLIPLQHPEFCPEAFRNEFARWLPMISRFDGVLTVSAVVADEYRAWRKENIESNVPFFVDWFHLGADMEKRFPGRGLPSCASSVLSAMSLRPTFLSVSTLEPRKGYGQSLAAFERLWAGGCDVNFVIVGRQGWEADTLAAKIERHPEMGRRLFWLRGVGDEVLDRLYTAADCVLFASEAEGFGLAVVEGAAHGRPLVLRDLPVFREIAGDGATYFSGRSAEVLADCLKDWLHRREKGDVMSSENIRVLSWDESANMLLSRLTES